MKKFLSKFVAILIMFFSAFIIANAQFIIKVKPGPPVIKIRPLAPDLRHIWIGGEYVWRGGAYVYTDGYWATPPPERSMWKPGHWKHRSRGWV